MCQSRKGRGPGPEGGEEKQQEGRRPERAKEGGGRKCGGMEKEGESRRHALAGAVDGKMAMVDG